MFKGTIHGDVSSFAVQSSGASHTNGIAAEVHNGHTRIAVQCFKNDEGVDSYRVTLEPWGKVSHKRRTVVAEGPLNAFRAEAEEANSFGEEVD